MSSEGICQSGPAHNPTPSEATRSRQQPSSASRPKRPSNSEVSQLSGPTSTSDLSFQDTHQSSKSKKKKKSGTQTNAWGLASTASTQSAMTPSIATTQNQEYIDLEHLLNVQQAQIDKVQEESAIRWNDLTQQVQANQATQTGRFDDLERKVTKSMKSITTNNTSLASLQQQFTFMMEMMTALTQKASRKRSKTRHLKTSRASDDDDGSQDMVMYPIPELTSTESNAIPTSRESTESDTEDIYSAPTGLTSENGAAPSTEVRNKKRSATALADQQEDEMSEDTEENEISSQISGVSQLDQTDDFDGILSDSESLTSDEQRLLAISDSPDEAMPLTLPTSPPLDAQYTNPRDPAGEAPD